jgi:hypothetical protein
MAAETFILWDQCKYRACLIRAFTKFPYCYCIKSKITICKLGKWINSACVKGIGAKK